MGGKFVSWAPVTFCRRVACGLLVACQDDFCIPYSETGSFTFPRAGDIRWGSIYPLQLRTETPTQQEEAEELPAVAQNVPCVWD